MFFVILSALIVSVFAGGTYVIPDLPCEWTLIWNASSPQYTWHFVQQVNGRFMRLERVASGGSRQEEIILRSDLDGSSIKMFRNYIGVPSEETVTYESVKHFYGPVDYDKNPLDLDYDTEKCGYYYGKECTIYHTDDDEFDHFVNSNGFLIGRRNYYKVEVNFTWQWKADLSWFAFPRSVSFNDDRIYTPPTESTCQQGTSSPEQSSNDCNYKVCTDGQWQQATQSEIKAWEEQSNECEQFTCDCGTGFVHFNREYICTGDSDVCVRGRCGTAEMFVESGAVVIITIDANITRDEVDLAELAQFISNETGIDVNTITLALNVDSSDYVIQVAVFVEDEKDAETVSNFANDLGKSNCTTNIL